MLPPPALRQALLVAPLKPLRGPWYRAVNYDHLLGPPPGAPPGARVQPLWSGGAARNGARFTPKANGGGVSGGVPTIECLYCAEDELTPFLEIAGVLRPAGSPAPLRFVPQVLMTVDGVLTDVLDLTDVTVQTRLGTSHQELTRPWLLPQAAYLAGHGSMPPTQELAAEAFATGRIVAMRYPSSKNLQGIGVVVFAARLVAGQHTLRVFNQPAGRLQHSLP
jgi:hypothetical protein